MPPRRHSSADSRSRRDLLECCVECSVEKLRAAHDAARFRDKEIVIAKIEVFRHVSDKR